MPAATAGVVVRNRSAGSLRRCSEPPPSGGVSLTTAPESWRSRPAGGWWRARLAVLDQVQLPELNDGHRLPGREGTTTPAAVLMPIIDRPEGLTLLLTQRSDALPDHPGQISFPGGRTEPYDPDPAGTALRE